MAKLGIIFVFLLYLTFGRASLSQDKNSFFGLQQFAINEACDPESACSAGGAGTSAPDPSDCHNYYSCVMVDGEIVPTLISCPSGYYFDADTSVCVVESEPCINKCAFQCPTGCENYLDLIGYPGDCSKYYICVEGDDLLEVDCPAETPYFNGAHCTTNSESCCDFCTPYCHTAGVQIADPYDCRKCYICFETGIPSEANHLSCNAEQVFDADLGQCVSGSSCTSVCGSSTYTTIETVSTEPASETTEFVSRTIPPFKNIITTGIVD